jgi:hypothetical protein
MPPIIQLIAQINQVGNDALDRAEADIKKAQEILNSIGGTE